MLNSLNRCLALFSILSLAACVFADEVTSRAAERSLTGPDRALAKFDRLDAAELRAQSAIDADPLVVPAYIALARRYELESQYEDALKVLNDALENPALKADVNLIVERSEVYFQQDELDRAAQDAYLALQ